MQCSAENKRQGAESLFCFDTETSAWLCPRVRPLEHKYGHTATVMGDSVFFFGGWSGKQASNSLVQLVLRPPL